MSTAINNNTAIMEGSTSQKAHVKNLVNESKFNKNSCLGNQTPFFHSTDKLWKCEVCQATANGYHYGVVSCEGCKLFFRRTVCYEKVYICKFNKNCSIEEIKKCKLCRFKACLEVGMSVQGQFIYFSLLILKI